MRRRLAVLLAAGLLLWGQAGWAHRIDEYLQATLLSLKPGQLQGKMRLIPGVQAADAVIAAIDQDGDGVFSDAEQRGYALQVLGDLSITSDTRKVEPRLLSWHFPEPAEMREGLGEIEIRYEADLPQGAGARTLILENGHLRAKSVYLMNVVAPQNRDIRIIAQKRDTLQSVYELDYQQLDSAAASPPPGDDASPSPDGSAFATLFQLGMRHIAEGTDHILFLLTLLLPAPLLAAGKRWRQAAPVRRSVLHSAGIVTAFTIGHSLTLGLAAMGFVHVPERPVEILIALSILVSALHALRPIFPGREAAIGGFFGLIHGLAFAATLDRLGLGRWDRLVGIAAFNLGIETMQILIVGVTLPSLVLMSRTPAYPVIRIAGAVLAGAASAGWIVERVLNRQSSVDTIVNGLAQQALWIALAFFLASLICAILLGSDARRSGAAPKG